MFSEGPPWRVLLTTSWVCRLLVDVNTLTSSGMSAPAMVPQEMIAESFHHREPSPTSPSTTYVMAKVPRIDTTDVIQTSDVSGLSKSNRSTFEYLARAHASLAR